ncbi:hypothetical protein BDZ85DRAFT_202870 [Elsinoe ampelina]|uniref:Geranylgeranyl pyrophosphate synthetase n=1 Tax=Elsinoe ampelina TaxID=302913 RepID=A0A6A6G5H5_9PEZI|nr:hypothetical protein BDZ85DRAFT_202870 [Elsinoe ampelina]
MVELPPLSVSQQLLERIPLSDAAHLKTEKEAKIKDVEYVASYNWKEAGKDPTIIVPGRPPRWQPSRSPQKLHEDSGVYYRDVNGAHFPSYPVEPALRAILVQRPGITLADIQIFGCGNTFGSLLSFVRNEERTFRFGVEQVGSSVFFVRKTNTPRETLDDVRRFGHAFPDANTIWEKDVTTTSSHQRVISYTFAGLKCFIRSESDGYLPHKAGVVVASDSDKRDDLGSPNSSRMGALSLGLTSSPTSRSLVVEKAGQSIPQAAIFDLKTRTIKKKTDHISADDFLHRLWVNQTPNFIIAFHTHGTFDPKDVHVIDAGPGIQKWESDHAHELALLGGVLHKLKDMARTVKGNKFEVRRSVNGPLEIFSEVQSFSALPDDLKKLWGSAEEEFVDAVEQQGGANDHSDDHDGDQDGGAPIDVGSESDSDEGDEDYLKF